MESKPPLPSIEAPSTSGRDPNKINTLFEVYPSLHTFKDALNLEKEPPISKSNISKAINLPPFISESLSLQAISQMKLNNHLSNTKKPQKYALDFIQTFETYKDPANPSKSYEIIGLKDFRVNTLNERSNLNDPTQKFSLAKKEKKAADLLMNLNFDDDGTNKVNSISTFE